jgi:hypothetical protein
MIKRTNGLWPALLLTGLLFGATRAAEAAGTIVNVAMTGVGSGPYLNQPFTCSFTYDQSHTVNLLHLGTFDFQGSNDTHKISYSINNGGTVTVMPPTCEPYTILTSANNKTAVQVTANTSNNSTFTVLLPMGTTLDQRHLPLPAAYPSGTALANSKFTLTGPTAFTGDIRTVSATVVAPAPVAPPDVVPVCVYPAPPAPCPVYACQPRPSCCFARLFARRCCRSNCW